MSDIEFRALDYWFRNPKDMTEAEKWSLPVGPIIQCERDWTKAEIFAGKAVGRKKVWAEMMETRYQEITPETTLWDLVDGNGNKWKLRQFKNGAWFREPIYL